MRNCFLSKYQCKLNTGCFIFPDTLVFVHCLQNHEQQRQSEVPRCKRTRKEISEPLQSSNQENKCKLVYTYIYDTILL